VRAEVQAREGSEEKLMYLFAFYNVENVGTLITVLLGYFQNHF
jgi:hypothetical protein